MYKITNIKVSIKGQNICLNSVRTICIEKKIDIKSYSNFVVVNNNYTYIIFKQNKDGINHINITKIKSIESVPDSVLDIKTVLKHDIIFSNTLTIDNITATYKLKEKIDLKEKLLMFLKDSDCSVKYNNERFPGLFLKFSAGTAILFHSGKVIFIGCKSEKNIEDLISKLCVHI